jgi:hypothetical protein
MSDHRLTQLFHGIRSRRLDWKPGVYLVSLHIQGILKCRTDPEIDLQVSCTAKLSIADLEGDGHFVVAVQRLVETFPAMRAQLDIVSHGSSNEAARSQQRGR